MKNLFIILVFLFISEPLFCTDIILEDENLGSDLFRPVNSPSKRNDNEISLIIEEEKLSYPNPIVNGEISIDSDFLEWFDNDILKTSSIDGCKRGISIFAKASGYSSGFAFLRIGFDFGERILNNVTKPVRISLSSLYGVCVYIPIAILGSDLSEYVFQDLFKKNSTQRNKLIQSSSDYCNRRTPLKITAITAGVISAPPMTYLALTNSYDWISYGTLAVGIPMFYVKTAIDTWSITALADTIYDHLSYPFYKIMSSKFPESYAAKVFRIREKLINAIYKIDSLNKDEVTHLSKITSKSSLNLQQQDSDITEISEKLYYLCNPEIALKKRLTPVSPSIIKKVVKVVGGCVGAFGMACIEPLAEASLTPVLSLIGMQNNPFLKSSISWASTITAASLMSWGTADSFGKLYDASVYIGKKAYNKINSCLTGYNPIDDHNNLDTQIPLVKRACITVIAGLLATAASGMQAELSIEFLGTEGTYAMAALICSMTSTWATNFWAVDNHILTYYSIYDNKIILQKKIESIISILPYLSEEKLESLEKIFS